MKVPTPCCAGTCAHLREGSSAASHQTSPIVKLIDPEHFTNSHPYEAILGAIDASWGVLLRLNFRRRLKKFLGKKNDPGSRVLGYPPFFLRNFIFSAQLELQPSKAAKMAPKPTRARFHCCSSALATVPQFRSIRPQLWQLKYCRQGTAVAMEASPGGFGRLFGCS